MPFTIIRQDIIKMEVDAIVNAANTELRMGGGVCGAIFKAAGPSELQSACDELAPIQTGEAVITPGFSLSAKYIIHTAGPVYQDGRHGEEQLLYSCYANSLRLAIENKCRSIAFPLISSGIYGYPKDEALRVASHAVKDFLAEYDLDVYIAVFDKAALAISEKLFGDVEKYISEHYVVEHIDRRRAQENNNIHGVFKSLSADISRSEFFLRKGMDDFEENLDEPFSMYLLRLIDKKGKTDVEVYKRANIDRKLFSKIRTGNGYMPSKRTVIALAIALELSHDETQNLLAQAGFALSRSILFDVIVEYFINAKKYDIYAINEVLFAHEESLLGV